jgi:hypothetical protein
MPKINTKRLLIALVVGIVIINIIRPVQSVFEYWFNAYTGLPDEAIVEKNIGIWMALMILSSIIFEVVIPMLIYVYVIEKFLYKSSLVKGLIFSLVVFFVGALPQTIMLPLFIKVSINYTLLRAFIALFNLVLIGGIIGGIYKPIEQEKQQGSKIEEDQSPI